MARIRLVHARAQGVELALCGDRALLRLADLLRHTQHDPLLQLLLLLG